ncbi:MAG: DNA polymerase III subunit gamma/tau [Candidatus Omnitrophica bacterium]|nr:DNA polymerase III subunit gamma/tau [Candidatus Omnitrophota bacterium]
MSYKAFALQYRPQIFDEVIGQENVVATLKKAIESKRVHHAYLFTGPRGVGKTSLARILAKSLNCDKGPTTKPCGQCVSCVDITKGVSLDVIEIDGASNRGIDEIRALREAAKLSPAHAHYKIYIIDEVHMLTQEAFNALLKTLEEPPEHVKFIFATTHPQKIIPTILSRCQKFQFSLLTIEKIVEKLHKIIKVENLKVDENLIYVVARAAAGSIRDAESLLDQIAPVVAQKAAVDDLLGFLGIMNEVSLNQAVEALVNRDLSFLLGFIDNLIKDGKDLGVFFNGLIESLRNLLLAKISEKNFNNLVEVSPNSKEFFLKTSRNITIAEILKVIDLLIEAKELSRRLNTVRVPLELAFIKFAIPSEDMVMPVKPAKPKVKPEISEERLSVELGDEFELELDNLDLEEAAAVDVRTIDKPLAKEDNSILPEIKTKWESILSQMHKIRAAIASHLSFAQPFSSQGNFVKVAFGEKDYFHKEIVEKEKNRSFVENFITEFLGRDVKIKFALEDIAPVDFNLQLQDDEEEVKVDGGVQASGSPDDFINNILDAFGGQLHTDD